MESWDEVSDGPAALLVEGGGEGVAAEEPREELDGRRPRAVDGDVAGRARGIWGWATVVVRLQDLMNVHGVWLG